MAIVISGVNNNDKITAADGTIDLLSGVSYASTITAPAFTATGNITAASINIDNNINMLIISMLILMICINIHV